MTAATLTFSQNPGASLQDVADRAGVGRATLYRHFATRDDLIRELSLEAIRETNLAVAAVDAEATTARGYLQLLFEALIPLGDRFHFLAAERCRASAVVHAYARQLRELADLVEALRAEGAVAPEVPTAWAVTTLDMLIWAGWSAVYEGRVAARDAPALAYRTFVSGLATPA